MGTCALLIYIISHDKDGGCCFLQEIQLKNQALDAFKETVKVFEDQIELHNNFQKQAASHEVQRYASQCKRESAPPLYFTYIRG